MVPPAENGAFFVTTNVVITPNQTWGECPEVSALVIIQSRKKLNGMLWFKYVKFHLSSESVESNRGMGMKNNLLSSNISTQGPWGGFRKCVRETKDI